MTDSIGEVFWRFITGHHLDGRHRTDAGVFRRGTEALDPGERVGAWSHKPRAERAAWRLGTVAGLCGGTYGYLTHPLTTEVVGGMLVTGVTAYGGRKVYTRISDRRHRTRMVGPLMKSLAGPLSLPLGARADKWLMIPKRPERPGQISRVYLPDHWIGEDVQKLALTRIVERWLGVPTEAIRWHLTSSPRFAEFTPTPQPPDAVKWKPSADLYRMHVGKSATGDVWLETLTDAPSVAFVGGSGSGKTTALTIPLVHNRSHGVLIDYIDLKRMSLTERDDSHPYGIAGDPDRASGVVSGVRIHTTIETAVRALAEFLASATAVALMQQAGEDTSHIPSRVLMMDEAGSFLFGVQQWWKGPGGQKGTNVIPFWLNVSLMQGRALNHRLVMGAHQLSLEMFGSGGSSARDLFAGRLLIGSASGERWVTTFGRIKKPAWDSKVKGRGCFGALGESPTLVQVAYIPQQEANDLLRSLPKAPAWFDEGCSAPWITEDHILEVQASYGAGKWVPGWEALWMDSEAETEAEPVQGSAKTAPGPRSESQDASQSEPGRESEDASQTVSQTVSAGSDTPPVQGFEYSGDPDVSDRPRLALVPELPPELDGVTLTEALRDGLVSGTIDAIRKASTREGFPEPVGRRGNANTYDPTELMMWAKWRGKNVG
jgi:hypothetical protein